MRRKPLSFLVSGIILTDIYTTSPRHTLLLVTRMSVWGFIYILCTLLCCKERSSLQQNKTKTRNTRKNTGKLGSSEKGVQSDASHCIWPWWSQATPTPTLVTGSAPRSPSCGGLGVMAPHFLKVITFLRVCHMASSLGL